jgi:hypothetical protein
MPLDPLFWLLVFLACPFMGAPFILMHHFAFFHTHKHLLKGKPRPPLDRGDLKDAWFWGVVMFVYQVAMWNLCGWGAIQSYGVVLFLGMLQNGWDVLAFEREKRRKGG